MIDWVIPTGDPRWYECAICGAKGLVCVDCHAHETHGTPSCLLHRDE